MDYKLVMNVNITKGIKRLSTSLQNDSSKFTNYFIAWELSVHTHS